ncbi:energy-coupling factor transporter transmembrane protein EcfT [Mycoplasma iguanae]|uniref:Energy-coupling factor transporter transmembrane protein EcfT n=1 Tax=Mycoplasma iguanae TaxID=292461 RepID=A0ABY5R7L6_9MOLU|nr:energy-coupling factor transporter transmembrane component T [Mycoplasma iguanae]UVD81448.1 energy-coupling factor transporter transmembrane protein EcfT [Mycoplasma iguanae]
MNIVIGKYIPMDTFLHKMDPRLKILINLAYIILFFIVSHFITLMFLFAIAVVGFIIASKKPWNLIKMIKMPFIVFIVILLINTFVIKEPEIRRSVESIPYLNPEVRDFFTTIWKTWNINQTQSWNISYAIVLKSFLIAFRIYSMILVTTILTLSTKPVLFTKAIEDLLFPFKLIKIPVNIIAMIISIALRFIPTLLDEANRIMKAQASRGVDFKNGKVSEKVKSMVTLTVPLFVIAFGRANDLANAMEVRGYDPYAKRTKYRSLKWKWSDLLVALTAIGIIIFIALFETNVAGMMEHLPAWFQYTNIKI